MKPARRRVADATLVPCSGLAWSRSGGTSATVARDNAVLGCGCLRGDIRDTLLLATRETGWEDERELAKQDQRGDPMFVWMIGTLFEIGGWLVLGVRTN